MQNSWNCCFHLTTCFPEKFMVAKRYQTTEILMHHEASRVQTGHTSYRERANVHHFDFPDVSHLQPLAATCSVSHLQPLALSATCSHLAATWQTPAPVAAASGCQVAASGCQVAAKRLTGQVAAKWLPSAILKKKWFCRFYFFFKFAASGCQTAGTWLQGARGCQVADGASGCKWLQVAASGCKWLQVAASGCQAADGASGCQVAAKWLQVVASGCKWLQVPLRSHCNLEKKAKSINLLFFKIALGSRLQPLATTCSHLAATCPVSHVAATCCKLEKK